MAPEGSRKHEGKIGPFKKGPFKMAMELKYPIVPIYFEGNDKLSPGAFMITRKGYVTAHIYPPVHTTEWTDVQLDEQIRKIRSMYLNWAGVDETSNTTHS